MKAAGGGLAHWWPLREDTDYKLEVYGEPENHDNFQINEKASVFKRIEVSQLQQINRAKQHKSRKSFNFLRRGWPKTLLLA
ncbi:hypothetical protein M7I_0904 [Glarea lozoyensis 74030]|uniref:Uncharacterized protein n=1 Tax=Glarea lozoyensis (strain ATCC 74030 / MF5533) TaxID=1104152 RepID=H0EEM4_GLAL7|nr:hypothetical protein M7I_0904 [Glarea lozoyensis 74030]